MGSTWARSVHTASNTRARYSSSLTTQGQDERERVLGQGGDASVARSVGGGGGGTVRPHPMRVNEVMATVAWRRARDDLGGWGGGTGPIHGGRRRDGCRRAPGCSPGRRGARREAEGEEDSVMEGPGKWLDASAGQQAGQKLQGRSSSTG